MLFVIYLIVELFYVLGIIVVVVVGFVYGFECDCIV